MWLLSALRVAAPPALAPGVRLLPSHWRDGDVRAFASLLQHTLSEATPVFVLSGAACAQALARGLRLKGAALVCQDLAEEHAEVWTSWLGALEARFVFAQAREPADTGTAWLESELKVPLFRALQRSLRAPEAPFAGIACASLPLVELAGYTADPVELLALVERTLVHRLTHAATGTAPVDWGRSVRVALAERITSKTASDDELLLLRGALLEGESVEWRTSAAQQRLVDAGLASLASGALRPGPLGLAVHDPVVWSMTVSQRFFRRRPKEIDAQTRAVRKFPSHLAHYALEIPFDDVELCAGDLLVALIRRAKRDELDPGVIHGASFFRAQSIWGARPTEAFVELRLRVVDLDSQGDPVARALHAIFELLDRPMALAQVDPSAIAASMSLAAPLRREVEGVIDLLRVVALTRTRSTRADLRRLRKLAARPIPPRARAALRDGLTVLREVVTLTRSASSERAASRSAVGSLPSVLTANRIARASTWSSATDFADVSDHDRSLDRWSALHEAHLDLLESAPSSDPPGARFAVAVAAIVRGDLDLAEEIARHQHAEATAHGYSMDAAFAEEVLASVARERGQFEEALRHLLAARPLYVDLDDRLRLRNLDAQIARVRGDG